MARRIYKSNEGGKEVSKPAVRIAIAGIAIGLAVMIISVAVVIGFKHQVKDKITGLSADILITSLAEIQSYQAATPAVADKDLTDRLEGIAGVAHVQRYSTKPGMIMTGENFQGMMLKGIAQEYRLDYLRKHLVEGEIPAFTDSTASNQVVVSQTIADRLKLKVGDKLNTYYLDEHIRVRRLTVAGIYQTHFSAFDDLFLLTDFYTVNRLNNWDKALAGGIVVKVEEGQDNRSVNDCIIELLDNYSKEHQYTEYYSRTVQEVYPQIFAWLDLLDINIWVILILMTGVAGFTMISGLLIIILERANMIGVLKALGADNTSIQKLFLSFSFFLIRKGMLWGNIVALVLCLVQYLFQPFRLDESIYYIPYVPIELNLGIWLLLNVCTLIISVCVLVAPSYLISRIHPVKSIRFE